MTNSKIEGDFRVIQRRPSREKDRKLLSKLIQATPPGHKIEVVELSFVRQIKMLFLRWETPALIVTVTRPRQSLQAGLVQQTIALGTNDSDSKNIKTYQSELSSRSELESYVASTPIVSEEQIARARSRNQVQPAAISTANSATK